METFDFSIKALDYKAFIVMQLKLNPIQMIIVSVCHLCCSIRMEYERG